MVLTTVIFHMIMLDIYTTYRVLHICNYDAIVLHQSFDLLLSTSFRYGVRYMYAVGTVRLIAQNY